MRVFNVVGLGNRTLDYEEFFGLWLNLDTQRNYENFHSAISHVIGTSKIRMPVEWIKAAISDPIGVNEWRTWDVTRCLKG